MGLHGAIVKMNRDEKIVFDHLKRLYGNDVIFEPIKNETPDILLNSKIAVEVRRLNQHYFDKEKIEGLENLSFSIRKIFLEVLRSFNTAYKGKSYWVHFEFERPFSTSYQRAKKELQITLDNFLNHDISDFPHRIVINPEFIVEIDLKPPVFGRVFQEGGSVDHNAGGWVTQTYVENIRHCIHVKSTKICNNLQKYDEWWLYLVDYLGGGLDLQEVEKVVLRVGPIGNFKKIIVLDPNDNNIRIQMENPE